MRKEQLMKTLNRNGLVVALFLAGTATAGTVMAQQQPQPQPQPQQQPGMQPPQRTQPGQSPPIVGKQGVLLGVTVEEAVLVTKGWSTKKHVLGKPIYNDKNEKIGSIEDVIISPDKTASYAIVGTGGFVGLDRHDVAIPFAQLDLTSARIVLPNATKEAIKALPEFQYQK
jgi:sporulation protein YlmC with PRC-barrel domain